MRDRFDIDRERRLDPLEDRASHSTDAKSTTDERRISGELVRQPTASVPSLAFAKHDAASEVSQRLLDRPAHLLEVQRFTLQLRPVAPASTASSASVTSRATPKLSCGFAEPLPARAKQN
ncbi:hypothetical protein [Amnibacterium sp.]|uniref:hypothetical protein n=1 Tax=Amnibacterium sp. TaxID=1872496 RepID=UPI003F7CC43C